MSIILELTRPKSITVNQTPTVLSVGTITETDTEQEESFFIPINLSPTKPPAFTIYNLITENGSNQITTINNGLEKVRVGDAVIGDSIPLNTSVISKTNNNAITISQNATISGNVSLDFDPPELEPTLYALRISHSKAGSVTQLKVALCVYDGNSTVPGTVVSATKLINLVPTDGQPIQINIDSFLLNLRVPQSP